MEIHKASFLMASPDLDHCPDSTFAEICFAGRSNVGKSSIINAVCGRKKLAKTSNTPGKTRLMNYYVINEKFHLVDLPGYGYAKVSKKERAEWGKEIERYLLQRTQLTMIYLLIDARHDPTALDKEMMLWLAEKKQPYCVILTKADKLSKNQGQKALAGVRRLTKRMNIDVPMLLTSAETKQGMEEFRALIAEFLG